MAYSDTPLAAQRLKDSQPLIRQNFLDNNTLISVNHVTFGNADAGKHKFITFPDETGAVPAFNATELGLFNQNAAPTNVQDLWFTRGVSAPFPMTGFNRSGTQGWTYIPSGLLMIWGNFNIVNGNVTTTITYNNPAQGGIATFPGFTTFIATVQLTRQNGPLVITANLLVLNTYSTVNFTCTPSQRGNNVQFTWFALGL